MPLESATFTDQLVSTNPADTDNEGQGAAHLRLIKSAIQATFPNFTAAALNSTQAEIDASVAATSAGNFKLAAGTAGAPALALASDATTGVYSAGVGKIDISIAGTQLLELSSAGLNLTAGNIQFAGVNVFPLQSASYGAGSVGTAALAAAGVTYANIQNVTAARLLGNPTGSAAAPSEISLGAGLTFSGSTIVGTPDIVPNISVLTSGSAATYTTPTSGGALPLYLRGRMLAGGGGGSGLGVTGSNGAASSFGGWTAVQGAAATTNLLPGAGGTGGSNGTGTLIRRMPGGTGTQGASGSAGPGVGGGTAVCPPSALATFTNQNGAAGATNSGGGGGGSCSGGGSGAGGGGGEYVEFIVTSPASSYTYTVGGGGAGGSSSFNGGAGAAGRIEVEAFWQ